MQTTTEVSLIQDDHVVEELAADGADHAFHEGIPPRGAWCSENLGDEHALHPSSKLAAVDAVAIAEEVTRRRVIRKRLDQLLRAAAESSSATVLGPLSLDWADPRLIVEAGLSTDASGHRQQVAAPGDTPAEVLAVPSAGAS